MKKLISLILSISMVVTGLPIMVYASNSTPEISLEEFTEQLQDMQEEYDDDYISEITITDGSEFYHIDGEAFPISDDSDIVADVSSDDFEIPFSVVSDYCDTSETSTYSLNEEEINDMTIDKETAEELGFEVEIEDDTAVLTQPYQTERLIIKSKYDINPLDSINIVEGYNDLHIVQFDSQESTQSALEYYKKQKSIEYAEPDLVVSTLDYDEVDDDSSDDTFGINYSNHLSWGSEEIGIDDYIDYIGDTEELPEIVVGIIDTGVDTDHEFIKDRIIRTYYNGSTSGEENSEEDDKGHGTHVAGIVVDNTTDNVKIKGYKVLNSSGQGDLASIVLAIDSAVSDGVNVINMSLGGKGESKAMENAVNSATEAGIVVCVSAGNSGANAANYTPAGIENCVTVAAYQKDGDVYAIPYWSNWGSIVDFTAPGVSIYSSYLDNEYKSLSGTSMACPFVTASVAMLFSKDTTIDTDRACTVLEENAKVMHNSYGEYYNFLYIGTITEYDKERTIAPKFSVESGRYSDSVTVELSCDEENAEIYYTLDGSRASKSTGILYTEPIVIDKVTRIHATAYAGDKLKSLQAVADYYITYLDDEGNFEIDSNGIITAYNGTNNYLTIPNTIAGITVTGIGKSVFSNTDLVMIKFPDTLTYVGKWSFYNCKSLKNVYCNNLKTVDVRGFFSCSSLEVIDLTQLEEVDEYGFSHCNSIPALYNDKLTKIERCAFNSLTSAVNVNLPNVTSVGTMGLQQLNCAESISLPKVKTLGKCALNNAYLVETLDLPELTTLEGASCFGSTSSLKDFNAPNLTGNLPAQTFMGSGLEYIALPNITSIDDSAFSTSKLKSIYIPSVTTINENGFEYATHLEYIYAPNVTEIGTKAFYETKVIKMIFAPKLEKAENLPAYDGVTLYLTDKFTTELNYDYDYTIVAPTGSFAETWANNNGYTFVASDSLTNSLGRSICTSVAGLRFGFSWDNIDEIEYFSADIEYGFVYSQKDIEYLSIETVGTNGIKKTVATNRVNNGESTTFNLVFANIPNNYINQRLSARAYVCIDGMYFYSDVMTGSFDEVAKLVIDDNEIDNNTKSKVQQLLQEA